MESVKTYIKESYNELVNKVTWPTWGELQNTTIVVLIGTLIITAIIYLMDNVASIILKNIIYNT